MKATERYIIFILLLFLFLFNACKKEIASETKESSNSEVRTTNSFTDKNIGVGEDLEREVNLYSYDKTVEILKQKVRGPIDFKDDLVFTYSIAMHTDSFFMVSYKPATYNGDMFARDISTAEWQNVKLEIIELYESIQFKGLNCDMSYLRPRYEISETMPILNFHTSSFNFVRELDKLGDKISYIDVNAGQLLLNSGGY